MGPKAAAITIKILTAQTYDGIAWTCDKCQRLPSLILMAANLWWVQVPRCMHNSVHYIGNSTGYLNHLFPESETPLNLSRSLALASTTAPGSLSFTVTLGRLVLLRVSVLLLLLGTNWLVPWSSRDEARSCASQMQYNNERGIKKIIKWHCKTESW